MADGKETCWACQGAGRKYVSGNGTSPAYWERCSRCDGTGRTTPDPRPDGEPIIPAGD